MFFVCFLFEFTCFLLRNVDESGAKISLATRVVDNCLSKEDRIRGLYTGFNSDLLPFHSSFYVFKVSCTFFVRIYLFFAAKRRRTSKWSGKCAASDASCCLVRFFKRANSELRKLLVTFRENVPVREIFGAINYYLIYLFTCQNGCSENVAF